MQAEEAVHVLRGIDLSLKSGEIVALVGASGSGKSTLLHSAGLLESPSSGTVIIDGLEINASTSDVDRTRIRGEKIGFIYQFHHLLPELSALENVMMSLFIRGISKNVACRKATDFLIRIGLEHRLHHHPNKLSGGEQQRVAIARALIGEPKLLLADEPTGNLDDETSDLIFKELLDLTRQHNRAALIATHDLDLARKMDRGVRLHNGLLEDVTL